MLSCCLVTEARKQQLFTLLFCLFHLPLFASFSADTLVKTSTTCISISQLAAEDTVACSDGHGDHTCKVINATRIHRVQSCLVMVLDDDIIITTSDQKLYCPLAHRGPHWDVIDPKGKHKNVLPGGRVC